MRSACVITLALLLPITLGCRVASVFPPPSEGGSLPLTARILADPDVQAAPAVPSPENTPDALPQRAYYQLTADACRALACRHCGLANMLENGATLRIGPLAALGYRQQVDWVRIVTIQHLSREARNRSAGAALQLYYKLLETELKADVLTAAVGEMDALIQANNTLQARGFKQAAEGHELGKQQVELRADQARLRAGVLKLNGELKGLLGIDPGTPGRLLPADAVQVAADELDTEQAVLIGLASRSDLQLLRSLAAMLDHRTLLAIRQSLAALAPPLGAVQQATEVIFPPLAVVVAAISKVETERVRRQILGLLADREREAAKEIRAAAEDWESARQLVAVARSRVELFESRWKELAAKSEVGMGVELELRKAKLEALQARSELISEACKWKIADTKARESMGLLCCDYSH